MEITGNIRQVMLNLGDHPDYVEARKAEINVNMYDNKRFFKCHTLAKSLHDRINVGVGQIPTAKNLSTARQSRMVSDAFLIRDLEMLSFIDRLMVIGEHNADLLRAVFTHAYNFGIDPDTITYDQVDVYRRMTCTIFSDFDTFVKGVKPSTSTELIRRVLSSRKDALAAEHYLRTVGTELKEPMLAYMDSAHGIEAALLEGTL